MSGRQGAARVHLHIAGIHLMRYTDLFEQEADGAIGATQILEQLKSRRERYSFGRGRNRKSIEAFLLRCAKIDRIFVRSRVGLGEAWATALAAGSLSASIFSVLVMLRICDRASVSVVPDFSAACFCSHLRCMFSVTAGDIMLSAIKAILGKERRKGNVHAAASH